MIDLTFTVEGIKYKLTSDDRQYILQHLYISNHAKAKNPGEEILSAPKFFNSISNVFAYITRTHPMNCDSVISSLSELNASQRAVGLASEALCGSITKECQNTDKTTNE